MCVGMEERVQEVREYESSQQSRREEGKGDFENAVVGFELDPM